MYPKKYNFYATGKIIKFSCWCHKWYTKLDFFIIRYKWNSEKCMCCQAALYRISFGLLMIYMELITQVEPCMDRKMVTSIWDYKELLWFINQLMHKKLIWGVEEYYMIMVKFLSFGIWRHGICRRKAVSWMWHAVVSEISFYTWDFDETAW